MKRTVLAKSVLEKLISEPIHLISALPKFGKSSFLSKDIYDALTGQGTSSPEILRINGADEGALRQIEAFIHRKATSKKLRHLLIDDADRIEALPQIAKEVLAKQNIRLVGTSRLDEVSLREWLRPAVPNIDVTRLDTISLLQEAKDLPDTEKEAFYEQYLRYGGCLSLLEAKDPYPLLNEILVSPIRRKGSLKDKRYLMNLMSILAEETGFLLTPLTLQELFLERYGEKTADDTLAFYLDEMVSNLSIGREMRFETRRNRVLKSQAKYYFCDHGLLIALSSINGLRPTKQQILETLVYNSFVSKGYEVYLGDVPCLIYNETGKRVRSHRYIDFLVNCLDGNLIAVQVVARKANLTTKLEALSKLRGPYRKVIIKVTSISSDTQKSVEIIDIEEYLRQLSN